MKRVKNTGNKIIHLENKMLLPEESIELSEKLEKNPMISFWESRGILTVEETTQELPKQEENLAEKDQTKDPTEENEVKKKPSAKK